VASAVIHRGLSFHSPRHRQVITETTLLFTETTAVIHRDDSYHSLRQQLIFTETTAVIHRENNC